MVEFVVLLGLAEKKVGLCREHWINLIIILLPLIAFLRVLRLVRLIRAGKMMRVYRVRSVYMRAMRIAVLFNLVERILRRGPEGYLKGLERKIAEKERELNKLKLEAAQLREELAAREGESG